MSSNTNQQESQKSGLDTFAHRVLITVGICTAVVLLLLFIWGALHILLLIFAGTLGSIILRWVNSFVCYYTKLPYNFSLILVVLLSIILFILLLILIIPIIHNQLNTLVNQIPKSLENIRAYIQNYSIGRELLQETEDPGQLIWGDTLNPQNLMSRVAGIFSTTIGAISSVIFIFLVSIYLAFEPEFYLDGLIHLVHPRRRDRIREMLDRMAYTVRWWLFGQLISMLILGVAVTTGLWLMGMPFSLVLGLLTAVMTFIPILGPIIASVPTLLVALTVSPIMTVYVGFFFLIIQNVEGYLITPLIHRRVISMPPVLIISVQFLLAPIVGFFGILLAMPLVACFLVMVQMLYVEDVLGDKIY